MAIKISEYEKSLQSDPSTSFWLKEQLQSSKTRDICNALADAEALVMALKARYEILIR
jgi:hypothetical protein